METKKVNLNSLKKEFENLKREKIVLILLDKNKIVFKEVTNISKNTIIHYIGHHKEYYEILKDTQFLSDKPKFKLMGIAHNHPEGEATPSKIDLDNWFYDILYFIYSNKTNELKIYNRKGEEKENGN